MPQELKAKAIIPWRLILLWVGGAVCIAIGFTLAFVWSDNRENIWPALGFIVFVVGGGYLLYLGWHRPSEVTVIVGSEKPQGVVNCLNIYAHKDEGTGKVMPTKVAFEWLDPTELKGQPWQCTNNRNWYYVNLWNIAKDRLEPFVLPDSQYIDPQEFANIINMPAHKNLFEREPSMMQKVAPGIMLLALIISIIGLIATTPVPV